MELLLFVFLWMLRLPLISSKVCTSEPADIVFVLDSSYSIWPPDFYRALVFTENVINSFNIGQNHNETRVGLLTYGHQVWPKFYLNTYFDKWVMVTALKRITYGEGKTTNTGDALTFTRQYMLSQQAGARKNATKIVIVVSDGQSQKTWFTQNAAKDMQDEGISLFAVSIGFRLDHKELAEIASNPDSYHYFSIDEYSDNSYIKKTIESEICKGADDERNTVSDTTAEFRKADDEILLLDCKGNAADVFFLIDTSLSINEKNFATEIEFVNSVIDLLDIGPNKTRVGIITFSDKVKFHVKLEYALNKEEIIAELNLIEYTGGGTDTAKALRYMREEGFFGSSSEIRENAARMAIVLTDGLSISPDVTASEAMLAHKMGIHIFSIGIGYGIDKRELLDMASEPKDKYMMHVDNFGALSAIKTSLAAKSCAIKNVDGIPFHADQAVCHPMGQTDLLFVYDAVALGSWKSQAISQFISKSLTEFNLMTKDLHVGRKIENCPIGDIPLGSAIHSSDFNEVRFQTLTDMIKTININKLQKENGWRINASKMIVLFADSSQRLNFETFQEVQKLKESVDYFFIVTIGQNVQIAQLNGVAGKDHTISVNNYDELHSLSDKLMESLCDFFFMYNG